MSTEGQTLKQVNINIADLNVHSYYYYNYFT